MVIWMFNNVVVSIITCTSKNSVIGIDGKIPWYYPKDLIFFKNVTSGYPVIMGRKTFESLGKALSGRLNIVISSSEIPDQDVTRATSLENALEICYYNKANRVFLIGGESVYKAGLKYADEILLTRILRNIKGDRKFPRIPMNFKIDSYDFDKAGAFDAVFLRYLKSDLSLFSFLKNRLKYKVLNFINNIDWWISQKSTIFKRN